MGLYINPIDGSTKEEFLAKYGQQVSPSVAAVYAEGGEMMPVVLVHNGLFTAAGVCNTPEEFRAFTNPRDNRPKAFFLVPLTALRDPISGLPKGAV